MKILRIPLIIVLVVLAGRTFHANAQTLTILYSFGSSPIAGESPWGLVQGSDGNFYGTSEYGGTSTNCTGCGTVFRIGPGGSYTNLYTFDGSPNDGLTPQAGLVQGSDGNFYGTTSQGGMGGVGTVFRISPSGTETILYSFSNGFFDGAYPDAGLVQGSDGNFYGTTGYGATCANCGGGGTVFRISPNGSFMNLYSFGSSPNGQSPEAPLVLGSDGNFYGTTYDGGTDGDGTVFRISPSGSYTSLYSFAGPPNDGLTTQAGLVQGSDGNFYGTTEYGGTFCPWIGPCDSWPCYSGCGTVFRIGTNGNETVLYSFGSFVLDGTRPQGGLVQGSDGNFYGTTYSGGTAGRGTVFRISPTGIYTTLYSFGSYVLDGWNPQAGLVQGSDGNFYGTTAGGGTYAYGTVFKLDVGLGPINTNCTFSINQTNAVFNAAGGSASVSVTAPNGCAWTALSNDSFITITAGSTRTGTLAIAGQMLTVTQSASPETILHSFGNSPIDGVSPSVGLVQGSDGNFYGTIWQGETDDYGTVFRISPSGSYTILYYFGSQPNDGVYPEAGLVQGSDGNFYGTTYDGGTDGDGTVFRISPSGSYTSLYSFAGPPNDGDEPVAGLVQASDGNFYGTTEFGGTSTNCPSGCGTVFRISPSGDETILYSFGSSPTDGAQPLAGLVQGSDGNLYGTTQYGGNGWSEGTMFRISPSGSYTNLYSFGNYPADGVTPVGLVQGNDGNFYGTSFDGGAWGFGTVFRISPSGYETIIYSFGGIYVNENEIFHNTPSVLVQGSDSNFYGTTEFGETYGVADGGPGTVFRISSSGMYTSLYQFAGSPNDGANPATGLVQGSDGNFYGTTMAGGTGANCYNVDGTTGCGTVFQLDVGLGPNCGASINSTTAAFSTAGGSASVSVTASNGCAWRAISNAGFITITAGSSGSGNGTVYCTVAANTSTSGRSGTMTIAGETFTVTQSGASAETALITVQANPSNGGTVSGGGTYAVGSSQQISATANSGWMFTGWSDGGAQTHNITVPSGGATYTANFTTSPCTYTLNSAGANVAAAGGSGSFGVTAGSGCSWTASSDASWLHTTSSGIGSGTVSYTVAADSGAARTGTMTIAGQTFAVYQAGATPVTYSFSTPVQTLKTRLNKKTGVTTTNCTITVDLVVTNTGATKSPKFSVLLWLEQGSAFNPSVGLAPLTKKVNALKEGKSVTIKIKTKKLTGDLTGTFIFATDTSNNVLASVEVPVPE
jgi:uncharacterized repeat protein (TIGR03803 family)